MKTFDSVFPRRIVLTTKYTFFFCSNINIYAMDPSIGKGPVTNNATHPEAIERGGLTHSALEALLVDPGTLAGHLIPGLLFMFFGLFWTYSILHKYHVARRGAILLGKGSYKSNYRNTLFSTYYACHCTNVSLDAYFLFICTSLGFIGEFIAGFRGGEFVVMSNTHHMCMYFFYGLTAFIHILMCRKHPIPADSDYATMIVACIVEALLFQGHINGRGPINAKIHMLLVYTIMVTVGFLVLEMAARRNVLISLARASSILVQGQWFCTGGFILYPPSFMPTWDDNSRPQMALVTTLFAVNIALAIIGTLLINYLIFLRVNCMDAQTISRILNKSDIRSQNSLPNIDPGKPLISDSDDEC
ncbi:transmembrane protein 45A isoform X1 [Hyalella azteca]|uniref:Transmembrane protein 45A isoform X1 n=1 Tax=Hyalella azteca TaxID=294128 RepID=A0A8B7N2R0_HYAAZ|nr:transmembrane protein 45A isoform X1 [Hyalella azteca]